MKKVKGIAAFAASVMALNSATVVFAASHSQSTDANGVGTFEGNVSRNDVFSVDLPTIPEVEGAANPLDFILDPNDLIKQTEGAKYPGVSFDYNSDSAHSGTPTKGLYFKNTGAYYDYSGKSNDIVAYNMGTNDVKINATANLSDATGINVIDSYTSAYTWSTTEPEICMSVTKKATANVRNIMNADGEATLTDTVDGVNTTSGWKISYNTESEKYEYIPEDESISDSVAYYFFIEGQSGGNWSGVEETINPKLDLTWSLTEITANADPSAITNISNLTLSTTADTAVKFDLGGGECAATAFTALRLYDVNRGGYENKNLEWFTSNNYIAQDITNGILTLTFKKEFAAALVGNSASEGKVDITFNNTNVLDTNTPPVPTTGHTDLIISFSIS